MRLVMIEMQSLPKVEIQSFELSEEIKKLKQTDSKNSYSHSKNKYHLLNRGKSFSNDSKEKFYGGSDSKSVLKKSRAFNFDPNIISKEEAMQLGFSDKQSNILINFRSKGGYFSSAQDLQALFGMTQHLFSKLEPYVQIDPTFSTIKQSKKQSLKKQTEINTADSISLLKLKGIGPVFARKIIKKRESLGGYYSLQQLKEINGMKDSLFEIIVSQLVIDTIPIRKLNLNSSLPSELEKHPYIGKKLASIIKNYRIQHGNFVKLEDVKKTEVFSDELLNKLKPYLIFP